CTLYAMIEHIKDDSINIISLENPVEYEIEGVKQVAVNDKTGLTFARGLRSVLRQDPDVIMVGEMRDRETVEIALQASLTGHLVLSTLHTNTTVGAVTRLRNMGVPSYLIASSLNGVVAQRLARRICRDCKAPYVPDADELARLGLKEAMAPGLEFYRGRGCSRCGDTGYRGRIGVFEILTCGAAMRREITADAHEESLARTAIGSGMRYMSQDGLDKVLKGETTIEEILRVLNVERETGMLLCCDCGGHLRPGFLVCPYCGASIVNGCPCCGAPREPEWKFCPYCVGKTA
ncbi:MAG: ATPase, T2SS/T4P/T4SS family, partial [Thermodesulfobacteriota bacterium]